MFTGIIKYDESHICHTVIITFPATLTSDLFPLVSCKLCSYVFHSKYVFRKIKCMIWSCFAASEPAQVTRESTGRALQGGSAEVGWCGRKMTQNTEVNLQENDFRQWKSSFCSQSPDLTAVVMLWDEVRDLCTPQLLRYTWAVRSKRPGLTHRYWRSFDPSLHPRVLSLFPIMCSMKTQNITAASLWLAYTHCVWSDHISSQMTTASINSEVFIHSAATVKWPSAGRWRTYRADMSKDVLAYTVQTVLFHGSLNVSSKIRQHTNTHMLTSDLWFQNISRSGRASNEQQYVCFALKRSQCTFQFQIHGTYYHVVYVSVCGITMNHWMNNKLFQ